LTQEVDLVPPRTFDGGGTYRDKYQWLEEDLKRRDENTARLAREMELAEAQSLRKQLDVEAREDADLKGRAADAIAKISSDPRGVDVAAQEWLKANPDQVNNPHVNSGLSVLRQNTMTDTQRKIKDTAEQVALLRSEEALLEAGFASDYREKNPDYGYKLFQATKNTEYLGALASEQQAKLQAAANEESFKDTNRLNERYGTFLGDEELALAIRAGLKKSELKVKAPDRLQTHYKPKSTQSLMFTDYAFINDLGERKAELEAAMNVLTNGTATKEEQLDAKDLIDDIAVDYKAYAGDMMKSKELEDAKARKLPNAVKAMREGTKETISLVDGFLENADASPEVIESVAKAIASNGITTLLLMKSEVAEIDPELYKKALEKMKAIEARKFDHILTATEDYEDAEAKSYKEKAVRNIAREVNDELKNVLDSAMTATPTKTKVDPADAEKGDAATTSEKKGRKVDEKAFKYASDAVGPYPTKEEKRAAIEAELRKQGYDVP
jgi:hypothetical protein